MVQIGGMIENPLEKKGFLMLYDMFMMYRRADGKRDRIGPDILIISGQTEDELGSSYDTETQPTPVCAFELVSPKGEEKDLRSMRLYLEQLEIPTCVMLYLVDDDGDRLPEAKLAVWRRDEETGLAVQAEPDDEGRFHITGTELWIGLREQMAYFWNEETGEMRFDMELERILRQEAEERAEEERRAREEEHRAREEERRAREVAEQQVEEERRAREVAEQKNAELLALLQKHGISLA